MNSDAVPESRRPLTANGQRWKPAGRRFSAPWIALLSTLGAAVCAGAPASLSTAGGTTAAWHDNATNADRVADVIPALELTADFSATWRWSVGRDDALFLSTRIRSEHWPSFDGLDRMAGGLRMAWQHKFGLGAQAPLLRVDLTGDGFQARERDRAGRAGSAVISVRKRLGSTFRIQAGHAFNRYDGRAHAFDRTDQETTLTVNADLSPAWRAAFSVRLRDGGVLSYATPPHPVLVKEGKALTTVTTFDRSAPMIAYYFLARTDAMRAEFGRSLGPRTELSAAVERRVTTRGPVDYANHSYTLSLNHSF